ncbi:MAG: hypothetical protein RMX69_05015 [Nostoc sp. EspVER01]|uniref:hypothetical protein n=1 Tax=Nostoc sp. EspVER01 TaxID=3075408 RepID=UPI002AD531C5|nr:hypothetical protein [Nostoc sp. EspVER01]MDZ7991573.1 hypothetical protein [Nostoc sp. EspVER01]
MRRKRTFNINKVLILTAQAIARIFRIVNKVKIYIRVKINGTIRIWQKVSYAYT